MAQPRKKKTSVLSTITAQSWTVRCGREYLRFFFFLLVCSFLSPYFDVTCCGRYGLGNQAHLPRFASRSRVKEAREVLDKRGGERGERQRSRTGSMTRAACRQYSCDRYDWRHALPARPKNTSVQCSFVPPLCSSLFRHTNARNSILYNSTS